jgi:hypothetical protein
MTNLTPAIEKEINNIIPDGAEVDEVFVVPNRGVVQVTKTLNDGRVNYTFYDEPTDVERLTKKVKRKVVEETGPKPFIIEPKPFLVR